MAKFAPIYMSVYDGPDYVLADLELSASTFADDAAEDAVIGALSGMASSDSVLSVVSGDVKIAGANLVVGEGPYTAGSLPITIRGTNLYGYNSPHDTEFTLTVTGD